MQIDRDTVTVPPHRRRLRARVSRIALLAAIGALPVSPSAAQQVAPQGVPQITPALDTAAAAELDSDTSSPFDTHFAEIVPPLGPDDEGLDLALPGDAVDLDSFEPPLEASPVTRSLGSGTASYYGRRFHGRRTANGERFDMHAMTAAHRTLPFGSLVKVTSPRNGQSVTVRINDRGPFARNRTIDVSRAAAQELGLIARGHGTVELELIEP